MNDRVSQSETAIPSEMEIVDCFTRLIFSADGPLSANDRAIVDTLTLVDCNLALCAETAEVGAYLRELGVSEMIRLVSLVQAHYPAPGQTGSHAGPHQHAPA